MKPNQIFECENTIGIYDADDKKFYEGICVALSATWCLNMLNGKRDLLSKPAYVRAGPLQAHYEIIYKNQYTPFLAFMGMQIQVERTFGGLSELITFFGKNDGQFMLRYPGHAMAAKISGGANYFFDPEMGLFKFPTLSKMEAFILKSYFDEFRSDWTARKVVLDGN